MTADTPDTVRHLLNALHQGRQAMQAVSLERHPTGRAHPATLIQLAAEVSPNLAPQAHHGYTLMGVPLAPDGELEGGVIVLESPAKVSRNYAEDHLPEHLRGVVVEMVTTIRVTVHA